jgi:hypothetical protein
MATRTSPLYAAFKLTAISAFTLSMSGCGKLLRFPDEDETWNSAIADLTGVHVDTVTVAEQNRRLMEHIDRGLTEPLTHPYFLIGVVGCALWTVAYALLIRRSYLYKVTTLPTLAICLNFTWEVMAVFILPNPSLIWTVLEWSWLVLDVGLVYLLFQYGKANLRFTALRPYFHPLLVLTLVLCLIGQLSFVLTFGDLLGFIDAFIINLVMSALFIVMFLERGPSYPGFSYAAAWLKMVGTACTSIQCAVLLPEIRPDVPSWSFLYFLCILVFVLDAVYVALLHTARLQPLSDVTDSQ